jgi:asparagine synthase (glutamine-hydrolysing)
MCGINGYFSPTKKYNSSHIKAMNVSMAHRGPDAQGVFTDELVGLGHLRLSILDLSESANQPMTSSSGRYIISYNGEVYNFKEVRDELKKLNPNFHFKTNSDTEVLLEAFEVWGSEMIQKFNGMFAIAIYDTYINGLYLFRDRLGIKPIYYVWDGSNFLFASELKALKKIDGIKLSIDKEAINLFLHLGYIPQPHSIYNEIKKFPSGSYAAITENKFEIISYWEAASKIKKEVLSDEVEAKKKLKELLISSVEYRLISDVPFGTFLSGGVDSSLVTAIAQSVTSLPVKTFSIGFKEAKNNESGYARAVANHLKTQHTEFTVTEDDAKAIVPNLMNIYDEPYADSSSIPTLMVSELARKKVTMTLSGDGGDELFMGYGAYNWSNKLNNTWLKYFHNQIAFVLKHGDSRKQRVAELLNYDKNVNLPAHIFSQEQYMFSSREIKKITTQNFYYKTEINYIKNKERKLSSAEEQAFFDLNYYLKDDLLVKVDRATMHHSLETRVPLIDYRIVEFALNLDENLKQKNGIQKYLLKQVLYDYVPKEIFDRPKWGFSIPLNQWLKNDLKYLIDKYLNVSVVEQYGVIQFEWVDYYVKQFLNGKEYYYNRVWLLIVLHQWFCENE